MTNSRVDDLTGRTFHKLTVLRLAYVDKKQAFWLCRCLCGNDIVVRRTNLLSGNTTACGCRHFHDLMGQKFGKLTVTGRAPDVIRNNGARRTCWYCQCDCGSPEKTVWADKLVSGKTVSCGCHRVKSIGDRRRTHGQSATPDYQTWQNMRRRCQDPNNHAYPRYGGRGIHVAPEFETFEGFIAYMGPCPKGCSLDRIDNNSDYAPGNVRWTNIKTQARNKRNNRVITFNGKTQSFAAWAEDIGITQGSLRTRLDTGWSLADALTLPVNSRAPGERSYDARKRARIKLTNAIATGRLVPQPCEVCGCKRTEGHHEDYSKPLHVRWLCRKHHAAVTLSNPNKTKSCMTPNF